MPAIASALSSIRQLIPTRTTQAQQSQSKPDTLTAKAGPCSTCTGGDCTSCKGVKLSEKEMTDVTNKLKELSEISGKELSLEQLFGAKLEKFTDFNLKNIILEMMQDPKIIGKPENAQKLMDLMEMQENIELKGLQKTTQEAQNKLDALRNDPVALKSFINEQIGSIPQDSGQVHVNVIQTFQKVQAEGGGSDLVKVETSFAQFFNERGVETPAATPLGALGLEPFKKAEGPIQERVEIAQVAVERELIPQKGVGHSEDVLAPKGLQLGQELARKSTTEGDILAEKPKIKVQETKMFEMLSKLLIIPELGQEVGTAVILRSPERPWEAMTLVPIPLTDYAEKRPGLEPTLEVIAPKLEGAKPIQVGEKPKLVDLNMSQLTNHEKPVESTLMGLLPNVEDVQFLAQRGLEFLPKRGGGSGGDALQLKSENGADYAFRNRALVQTSTSSQITPSSEIVQPEPNKGAQNREGRKIIEPQEKRLITQPASKPLAVVSSLRERPQQAIQQMQVFNHSQERPYVGEIQIIANNEPPTSQKQAKVIETGKSGLRSTDARLVAPAPARQQPTVSLPNQTALVPQGRRHQEISPTQINVTTISTPQKTGVRELLIEGGEISVANKIEVHKEKIQSQIAIKIEANTEKSASRPTETRSMPRHSAPQDFLEVIKSPVTDSAVRAIQEASQESSGIQIRKEARVANPKIITVQTASTYKESVNPPMVSISEGRPKPITKEPLITPQLRVETRSQKPSSPIIKHIETLQMALPKQPTAASALGVVSALLPANLALAFAESQARAAVGGKALSPLLSLSQGQRPLTYTLLQNLFGSLQTPFSASVKNLPQLSVKEGLTVLQLFSNLKGEPLTKLTTVLANLIQKMGSEIFQKIATLLSKLSEGFQLKAFAILAKVSDVLPSKVFEKLLTILNKLDSKIVELILNEIDKIMNNLQGKERVEALKALMQLLDAKMRLSTVDGPQQTLIAAASQGAEEAKRRQLAGKSTSQMRGTLVKRDGLSRLIGGWMGKDEEMAQIDDTTGGLEEWRELLATISAK